MEVVAGIDLGGTAINYTLLNHNEEFLISGLCEHPALAKQGPDVCLKQMEDGLNIALQKIGIPYSDVVAVGLDTPGPASAAGQFSAQGSTNFVHAAWANYDIREGLARRLGKPVTYLNDANAAALWGHYSIFGTSKKATSISVIVGTGNGGGIIIDGEVVKGKNGFGGELGHVLIPSERIKGIETLKPQCGCGRIGDLESVCSLTAIERNLLPHLLPKYPGHELGKMDLHTAAKAVRGMADKGDALSRDVFRAQAHSCGLFFDQMINTFDPDALIIGGGVLEASESLQKWFVDEIRNAMPPQRKEQANIPIYVMPNGDTAGARGAAIDALKMARAGGLA